MSWSGLATVALLAAVAAPAYGEPGALPGAVPTSSIELAVGGASVEFPTSGTTRSYAARLAFGVRVVPSFALEGSLATGTYGLPEESEAGPFVVLEMWSPCPPTVGGLWGRRLRPDLEVFARARYGPRTRTRRDPQGKHSGDVAAAVYLHDLAFGWSQAHTATVLGGGRWQRERWTAQADLGVLTTFGSDSGRTQSVLRSSLGAAMELAPWSVSTEVVILSDVIDEGVVDDYDVAAGFYLGGRRELGGRWHVAGTLSTTAVRRRAAEGDDGLAVLLGVGYRFSPRSGPTW